MKRAVFHIGKFALECVLFAVLFGVGGAILFLPFGILVAVSDIARGKTFNWGVWLVPSFLGTIIGGVWGVGQVFVDRFSDPLRPKEVNPPLGRSLADFYLGSLKPTWWSVIDAGSILANKDWSKQRPGRWNRAVVGAVACMLLMGFLVGAIALGPKGGSTKVADSAKFAFAFLVGFAGLIGGVLGALTDSR